MGWWHLLKLQLKHHKIVTRSTLSIRKKIDFWLLSFQLFLIVFIFFVFLFLVFCFVSFSSILACGLFSSIQVQGWLLPKKCKGTKILHLNSWKITRSHIQNEQEGIINSWVVLYSWIVINFIWRLQIWCNKKLWTDQKIIRASIASHDSYLSENQTMEPVSFFRRK